jgi:hypothetical protein
MAEVKHGTVSVTVADALAPPPKAGNLSAEEVKRLPKARRGIGLACEQTADAIEKLGPKFTLPAGVTAASLRTMGSRAEDIDQVITDLEVVLATLKQANLMFDAEAWEQIRKVNDQVKAQAKHDPELLAPFKALVDYFARGHHAQVAAPAPAVPAPAES